LDKEVFEIYARKKQNGITKSEIGVPTRSWKANKSKKIKAKWDDQSEIGIPC